MNKFSFLLTQTTSALHIRLDNLIFSAEPYYFIVQARVAVWYELQQHSGIDVDRPTAQTAVREEQGSMIIGINKNGEIWMENQKIDLRAVRAHVEHNHAQNPEGTVIILADENARTGLTVEVLDQVRLAGVTNVSIAASKE